MATWTTLLKIARNQLGDRSGNRWDDESMIDYFLEAQEIAARRGYLMREEKSETLALSTIEYDFPTDALYIVRIMWGGRTQPLEHRTADYMDRMSPGWDQGSQTGDPDTFVTDKVTKKFHIWRTPDQDAIDESTSLTLGCVMLPSSSSVPGIDEFRDDTSTPEIEPEHHFELIDYVKYRCHSEDEEADGDKKAANDLALFNRNMEMAKREFIQQRAGNTTQYPKVW